MPYFLVGGIYPSWRLSAQLIHKPASEGESKYKRRQEALRKDIERCFGVLQASFNVLWVENKMWYIQNILDQASVCVILHNRIVARDGKNSDYVALEDGGIILHTGAGKR